MYLRFTFYYNSYLHFMPFTKLPQYFLLSIVCLMAGLHVLQAQEPQVGTTPLTSDDIVFKREFSIGLKAHTHGYGVSVNRVRIENIFKKKTLEIEVSNIKHPKERRQQSPFASGRNSARGYVYGKQNSFYQISANFGTTRTISNKGQRNGVQVAWFYSYGPSLGITKPYYLELIYDVTETGQFVTRNEKYTSENASWFLNEGLIYGASGITYGWNDINFFPGLQVKGGFNFDWANFYKMVKALEIGFMVNVHAGLVKNDEGNLRISRVPIMIEDDNSFLFTNLYLRLNLGKRW
ncbi:hypothetical protein C7N43_37215 [Sphingobacteriales bacterium UPWRP_1]|nr:hypothetical protein C7N43_37215 [Sphingobacteriales bacterium UPWRP_1]